MEAGGMETSSLRERVIVVYCSGVSMLKSTAVLGIGGEEEDEESYMRINENVYDMIW